MIILTVISGPDKGRVHRLGDDAPVLIGRRNGDAPIDDSSVSRQHARLEPKLGSWEVTDLGSSNGTVVNKYKITEPTLLSDGDRIQVGRSIMTFQMVEGAVAAPVQGSAAGAGAGVKARTKRHSDDTHHGAGAEALHHALELQQQNQQALDEIRQALSEVAAKLAVPPQPQAVSHSDGAEAQRQQLELLEQILAAVCQLSPAGQQDAAAEIRAALKDISLPDPRPQLEALHKAVVDLPRPADPTAALEPLVKQFDAIAASAAQQGPQTAAELNALREAIAALPAQMNIEPAIERVLAAVSGVAARPQVDHAAELKSLREAIENAPRPADHGPALAEIRQALAAPPPPDDRLLASLDELKQAAASGSAAQRETIEALQQRLTQQFGQISRSVAAAADRAPIEQAIGELKQAIAALPAPVDVRPQLEQLLARPVAAPDDAAHQKLAELHAAVTALAALPRAADHGAAIEQILAAVTAGDDGAEVKQEIAALREQVLAKIEALPAPPAPENVAEKLRPVIEQVQAVQETLANLPPPVDLRPQLEQLLARPTAAPDETAHQKLAELSAAIAALPAAPADRSDELLAAVTSIKDAIESLPKPEHDEPLHQKLSAIESAIAALPAALPPSLPGAGALPGVEEKLDTIILAVAREHNEPGVDAKLDVIYDAIRGLAESHSDRELAALLAAAQHQPGTAVDAAKIAGLEAMLLQIAQKLEAQHAGAAALPGALQQILSEVRNLPLEQKQADATEPLLKQILAELRHRPVEERVVTAAIAELRETVEKRQAEVAARPETARAAAAATGELAAKLMGRLDQLDKRVASMRDLATPPAASARNAELPAKAMEPVIELLQAMVAEISAIPKRQEKLLGELYAAMRDLQLQQDQQVDRIIRLMEIAEGVEPQSPAGSPIITVSTPTRASRGIAARVASSPAELASLNEATAALDSMESNSGGGVITNRQPSLMLTVAVVFFIVVATLIAGGAKLL